MSCPFEPGSDVYFVSTTYRSHNFCTATTYRHNGNSILCIVPFCFFTAGNRFPSTRFSKHTWILLIIQLYDGYITYHSQALPYHFVASQTFLEPHSFRGKYLWPVTRLLGQFHTGLSPPASIDTTHQYQAYQKVLTGHPTGGEDPSCKVGSVDVSIHHFCLYIYKIYFDVLWYVMIWYVL